MAATAQDGVEQGSELVGVPQGKGAGQQAETSRVEKETPRDTHASSKDTSLADGPTGSAQLCAGTDRGPGVENGAGLDNGTGVDSAQDISAHRQNIDESTSQQDDDAQQISGHLSDVPQDTSSAQPQKRTARSRKNPRPMKVATSPKSATPSCAQSEEATPQKKRRGRKPKAETLPPTENLLASTPTPQNQCEAAEEQEMTLSGRPKRRAAKAAMEYLHSLVEDLDVPPPSLARREVRPAPACSFVQPKERARTKAKRARKSTARIKDSTNNASGDEDFVPDYEAEAESEEEFAGDDEPVSCFEKEVKGFCHAAPRPKSLHHSSKPKFQGKAANGLMNSVMGPIWRCAALTKQFREEYCASWVFPEWIPSAKDWRFLSAREAETYLPKEKRSPAFRVSREGLTEDGTPCRINRFDSVPWHAERWDMAFFVGGPVWSMEWCPCPDGSANSQFAAIYCNKGMDDRHKTTGTYSEPVLLQVWDLGELQYDACPSSPAQLAYAIALDDGCIWDMKWCPSSAWELPTISRKTPHMARLGLLAIAFSNGKVAVYSLPHRDALMAVRKSQAKGAVSQAPMICQVKSVAVLKVGAIQAEDAAHTGQCFCLDWLSVKPHNIVAAGFFDGSVALWNLNTKSLLQRVRASDGSVTLYPYHSFMAHDNVVQSLAWCRASSDLLATAGDDRMLKFWDLRKTYEPVSIYKRYLTTEICWPLIWSGVFVGQQCCYATYGQHGIHYIDAGYLGYKPYYMAPRRGTIWSASFSDWLNTCVTADNTGELIMILLPDLNYNPNTLKRTAERRFPVFRAEMVPFPGSKREECNGQEPQTYSEAVKKYFLHFHDMDMRTFKNASQRAPVKRMLATEAKGILPMHKVPLGSLHKVRLNPNMCSQSWVLSAGQAGVVRAHCLRSMNSPVVDKMVRESEAQFSAMFLPQGATANASGTAAVRHSTESTVKVL
ncbi:hypothetical protein SKAU_G00185980 [Synaphobranchus kaupii]|uniref:General transcription factor 3C polypeptide 2 n=1 Tax=Synaphobranchus kaupii TaxID=118154 RepID=A0A9Q1FCQ5_SYNKA|nr:hypothetical protein SKAU_G00185980 [Synaphobranchus kaupii]